MSSLTANRTRIKMEFDLKLLSFFFPKENINIGNFVQLGEIRYCKDFNHLSFDYRKEEKEEKSSCSCQWYDGDLYHVLIPR